MALTKKGGEKKGPVCHQWGGDQRITHQHSQAHPWSKLRERCPLDTWRDPEICQEVDGNHRCAHGLQAQQNCLGQRSKEHPILYQYGCPESVMKMKSHQTSSVHSYLCTCHHLQKPIDRDFPGGAGVKNLPAKAGDTGLSPGLGRSHMPRSN